MDGSGGGAGIMLAVAAVLWLVYLLPTWFKRREYVATERNAVRLQQTLRILAETAEVPAAVRAEATAKSVAEQQRILKLEAQRAEAIMRARNAAAARAATKQLAETRPSLAAAVSATGSASRRLRRTRAFTGLTFIAAVFTVLVQATLMLVSGVAPAAWGLLGFAAFVGATSFALLGRLANLDRARRVAARAAAHKPAAPALKDFAETQQPRQWTPVPLPKPLYLEKPRVERPVMADPREDERRAAAIAASELTPITAPASATAAATALPVVKAPSRFASMGLVDLERSQAPDVDAALARRRAAAAG